MSRAIEVERGRLKFPRACVVCLSPASQEYTIQHTGRYGRTSLTITLAVPMCEFDYQNAVHKSLAERAVGWAGLTLGLAAGVVASGLLLAHWADTGQGELVLNLFSASIFGLGLFLIIWAPIASGLAPLFAAPASKEARNAVRLTRYWPKDQYVRLEFRNEAMAGMVEQMTTDDHR